MIAYLTYYGYAVIICTLTKKLSIYSERIIYILAKNNLTHIENRHLTPTCEIPVSSILSYKYT